ncbi:uncharacterized protein [Nicotiana tomentosiformis]|uniref:uncharacterized protein n=1 Tax=Nicotiana tomentosiformis TaxID=4098 RepID=UPI00388C6C60
MTFLIIGGMQMKLQKWTTDFKHEVETTMAPVWINLPDLRWHYFEWATLCRIVEPIGIPIITDKATLSKTRQTTAKIKVEIDITRPLLHEIRIDILNEKGQKEIVLQKVEYKSIPEYCNHCKMQGHSDLKCEILHPELRQNVNKANERKEIHPNPKMVTQVKNHTKNSHAINNLQGSKDNHEKQQKCDSVKNDKIEEIKKSIPSRLQKKLTFTSMGTESVDQMRQRNIVVNKARSQPKQEISRKIKISKKNNFVEKVKHPDERETKSKKRRFNREDAEENKA